MQNTNPRSIKQLQGCQVEIRQLSGVYADELFLRIYPLEPFADHNHAVNGIYGALASALEAEGADLSSVVNEWVFCADMPRDLATIRAGREAMSFRSPNMTYGPAINEIGQAPLNPARPFEMLFHATLKKAGLDKNTPVTLEHKCDCAECARTRATRVTLNGEHQLYASGIFGAGDDAYEQTLAMFTAAEQLLDNAGMGFADVTRTWIYFSAMERDYAGFNKARREFFTSRGVNPIPASTGIGADLPSATHRLSLGFVATRGTRSVARTVMTTPTLNEAGDYGSDFSRGMRADEINRTSLYVSGTASLDETGATVHLNDIEKQAARTLLNLSALLEQQASSFQDVLWAITYIKHPEDAPRVLQLYEEAGFSEFPHIVVEAEVCRPELLCETELLAVPHR